MLCFCGLPYELKLEVFSYLSKQDLFQVAMVCKEFRTLAYDPSLWKSVVVKSDARSKEILPLFNRAQMLEHLTVRASREVNSIAVNSNKLPLLRSLDMGFSPHVSSETIALFVKNCPLLSYLNVEGCRDVDEDAVSQICKFQHLRSLILSHCCLVTDDAIMALSTNCPGLRFFNADGITRISDRAVCCLARNLSKKLVWLELDGEELTDASFYAIKHCTELETLFISYAENLTDASLSCIEELRNLKRLKLRRGPKLSAEGIRKMFMGTNLQNLTFLEFDSLSLDDDGVSELVKCCPKLQSLALPWCWDITDLGLSKIVAGCRNLISLVLLGLFKIYGYCLAEVPAKLPKLRHIRLEQCNEIIDSLLEDLVRVVPHLQVYNYYGELVVPTEDESEETDTT